MEWYRENARDLPWRRTRDPYHILVSEIMLQQTRVQAVLGYYDRFLAAFPNPAALAAAEEGRLLKLWEGLGYYSRARNLQKAARACVETYSGALPDTYEALLSLPGVGEYTAGAVASIAYGIPVPAVDGNVLRVLARINCDSGDIADPAVKKRVRETLLAHMPKEEPGLFNQALMELGATVCLPNGAPKCEICPVAAYCRAREEGQQLTLPVKGKKKPRRIEEKTVYALFFEGKPLGHLREAGVLKGLWQLPEEPGRRTRQEMGETLTSLGLRPVGELAFLERKHIFTHVEWHMLVCRGEVAGLLPQGLTPLSEEEALPTAYRICLE